MENSRKSGPSLLPPLASQRAKATGKDKPPLARPSPKGKRTTTRASKPASPPLAHWQNRATPLPPMPQRAKPLHSDTEGAKRATVQPYPATPQKPMMNKHATRNSNRANVQGRERASQAPLAGFIIGPPRQTEGGDLLTEFLLFNKSPSFHRISIIK